MNWPRAMRRSREETVADQFAVLLNNEITLSKPARRDPKVIAPGLVRAQRVSPCGFGTTQRIPSAGAIVIRSETHLLVVVPVVSGCNRPFQRTTAGRWHRAKRLSNGSYAAVHRLSCPLHSGYQGRIGIDGLPIPPPLFRSQLEDRKMQVRGARIRVSRRSHKTDDVPTLDLHSLTQPVHVPGQVSGGREKNTTFFSLVIY